MVKIHSHMLTSDSTGTDQPKVADFGILADVDKHVNKQKPVIAFGNVNTDVPHMPTNGEVTLSEQKVFTFYFNDDIVIPKTLLGAVREMDSNITIVDVRGKGYSLDKEMRTEPQLHEVRLVLTDNQVWIRARPATLSANIRVMVDDFYNLGGTATYPEAFYVGRGVLNGNKLVKPGKQVVYSGASTTGVGKGKNVAKLIGNRMQQPPTILKRVAGFYSLMATALAALMRLLDNPKISLAKAYAGLNPSGNVQDSIACAAVPILAYLYGGKENTVLENLTGLEEYLPMARPKLALPFSTAFFDVQPEVILNSPKILKAWVIFNTCLQLTSYCVGYWVTPTKYVNMVGHWSNAPSWFHEACKCYYNIEGGVEYPHVPPVFKDQKYNGYLVPCLVDENDAASCSWGETDPTVTSGQTVNIRNYINNADTHKGILNFATIIGEREGISQTRLIREHHVAEIMMMNGMSHGQSFTVKGIGFLFAYLSCGQTYPKQMMQYANYEDFDNENFAVATGSTSPPFDERENDTDILSDAEASDLRQARKGNRRMSVASKDAAGKTGAMSDQTGEIDIMLRSKVDPKTNNDQSRKEIDLEHAGNFTATSSPVPLGPELPTGVEKKKIMDEITTTADFKEELEKEDE